MNCRPNKEVSLLGFVTDHELYIGQISDLSFRNLFRTEMEGSVRRLSIITTKILTVVCSLVVHLPSGSWSPGRFWFVEVWLQTQEKLFTGYMIKLKMKRASHSLPIIDTLRNMNIVLYKIIAARCERAATYCEGRARKVDVRASECGSSSGFRMSHDSHMTLKEQ